MKKLSDPFLARRLIENRERGFTFSRFLCRSWKSYLVLLVGYELILSSLAYVEAWMAFSLVTGILVGCLVRDFGWVRRIRQTLPFSERVTDWEEVERLAGESSADQAEAR